MSGGAWLRALLDAEAAYARACAREGVIPEDAAREIAAACRAEDFDADGIAAGAAAHAQLVVPLVAALRERVGPAAREHVHRDATSQDILDTAAMLVARRALEAVLDDAGAAADACATLAADHGGTPIMGRTLLQPARPTTFGATAAGWGSGIAEARASLERTRDEALAVQVGGPVGDANAELGAAFAQEMGLAAPARPWHTNRRRPAELAAALGVLAGACGKVALDVTLLAGRGEVRERGEGRGASSSMPHKRNPVAAISARACAARAPGLVSTMLAAMAQEHERAAGSWQAEWETLSDLLRLTGAAAAWTRDSLEGLEIDAARMRDNLDREANG